MPRLIIFNNLDSPWRNMLRLGIFLRFYGSKDTLRLAELLGGIQILMSQGICEQVTEGGKLKLEAW